MFLPRTIFATGGSLIKEKNNIQKTLQLYFKCHVFRSSHPEMLEKGVLKICRKFTGEHPCQSAISIKLQATLLKLHFSMGVLL